MRNAQGGTQMYCPHCKCIRVCEAVPTTKCGALIPAGQRWYRKDYEDVQWFRRGRECKACGQHFITAEVNELFLTELGELRNALASIKKNAEDYVRESHAASESLAKLAASLEVLRALKVYEDASLEG